MTQKEKYNAAIEQAKKELATCGSMDCDAARLIFRLFPQLRKEEKPLTSFQQCLNCILRGVYYAEVPDEKVNEFILNVVRTRTDELIKLAKKQEEQKHPDGCFTCDEYKKGYEAGRLNGFTAGYNKAMKEVEQEEQKPVERSDEDEKIRKWLIDYFTPICSAWIHRDISCEQILSWLKSLRPQPKEELAKMLQDEYNKGKEYGEMIGHTKGYNKGYKDAEEAYNKAVSFHYDNFHNSIPCYAPGGICTNPHFDCINCPKKTTGGSFMITGISSVEK